MKYTIQNNVIKKLFSNLQPGEYFEMNNQVFMKIKSPSSVVLPDNCVCLETGITRAIPIYDNMVSVIKPVGGEILFEFERK